MLLLGLVFQADVMLGVLGIIFLDENTRLAVALMFKSLDLYAKTTTTPLFALNIHIR